MATMGLEYGEVEYRQPCMFFEHGIDLFGNDGVCAVWAGGDWGVVRGDGYLEREKGTRTKVGFGRRENIGELAEDVVQGRDD